MPRPSCSFRLSRARFRLAAALSLTAVAALSLVGTARAEPLRLGVDPRLATLPLHVAAARGYFEREGVEVELVPLALDDDAVERLAEEELELAVLGADALLRAEGGGLELRGAYVLGIGETGDAIVAREEIRDTRQLRGRRVALVPGSAGELLLRWALQRKGRRLADVERVVLPPERAAEALLDGVVDAAALTEPTLSGVLSAGGTRVLASAADARGLVSDLLVGDEDALAADKERVKDVVRAIGRAVAWMRRNPDEAVAIVAERYGIDADRAARALAGVRLLGVDDNMQLSRGEFQKAFSEMSEVLAAAGPDRAREVPSANRYLSLSALRQVAAGR